MHYQFVYLFPVPHNQVRLNKNGIIDSLPYFSYYLTRMEKSRHRGTKKGRHEGELCDGEGVDRVPTQTYDRN